MGATAAWGRVVSERTSDPEAVRRLLLAAASTRDSDLAALAHDVDLDDVARAAEYHRITSIVFSRLARHHVDLPESMAEYSVGVQARRLHAQRTVTAVAAAIDVPFLVFKGPALAAEWYDDPDDRAFGDIDVLVRRTDFEIVLDTLVANDFALLSQNWQGFLDYQVAELPLAFESSIVDLHWHPIALGALRRQLRLDEAALFARARETELGTLRVATFDDVDTLLHLCIHTGLDGALRLRGLIDIDRVIESGRVDLGEFATRAREADAQALCAAVLQRCESLLGTRVEPSFLRALSPWPEWLVLNRWVDRSAHAMRGRSSSPRLAPGSLLGSGRTTRRATLENAIPKLREGFGFRRGRPGLADAGAPLDWQRRPPSGEQAARRRDYLDWVGDASSLRVRRCRNVDELHRLVGHLQPRTTPFLGAALLDGLGSRRCRADLVERDDGRVVAALVRYRWSLGRCTGFPVLFDQQAAFGLAEVIDGSDITDLGGLESDTIPLQQGITRWRSVVEASVASVPPGFLWEEEYPTTRPAERRDLSRITQLVWDHAPQSFPNPWSLRRRLKRAIADVAFVVEAGRPGHVVGVILRDSSTPEYDYWAQIVVDPDFRGQGFSWHLIAAAAADASRKGVGGLVLVSASNPMPIPDDATAPESWVFVMLAIPQRVRGERRLRQAIDALTRFGARRALELHRTPGADDQLTTDRRRQQWWRDRLESRE